MDNDIDCSVRYPMARHWHYSGLDSMTNISQFRVRCYAMNIPYFALGKTRQGQASSREELGTST